MHDIISGLDGNVPTILLVFIAGMMAYDRFFKSLVGKKNGNGELLRKVCAVHTIVTDISQVSVKVEGERHELAVALGRLTDMLDKHNDATQSQITAINEIIRLGQKLERRVEQEDLRRSSHGSD